MRVFGYVEGSPGYIAGEIATTEHDWAEVERRGLSRTSLEDIPGEACTREELLAVSTRRRALLAWEGGDDSVMERTEADFRYENESEEVRMFALEGCLEAQAIVSRGLDRAECSWWAHVHSCERDGCAWYQQKSLHSV